MLNAELCLTNIILTTFPLLVFRLLRGAQVLCDVTLGRAIGTLQLVQIEMGSSCQVVKR